MHEIRMHLQLVYSFNAAALLCQSGCFMKMNLENYTFLRISLLSACQELCFLSPTWLRLVTLQGTHGCSERGGGAEGSLGALSLPIPGPRGPELRALTHLHQFKMVGVEDTQVLDGDLVGRELLLCVVVHHLEDHVWREEKWAQDQAQLTTIPPTEAGGIAENGGAGATLRSPHSCTRVEDTQARFTSAV